MKWLKALIFILVIALGSTSVLMFQFARNPFAPGDAGKGQAIKKIEIDILKGMRPIEISYALEKHGIIRSARLFYWLGRLTGGWSGLKAADYELSPSMTPLEIFQAIRSGIGIQRALLIHEGDNIYQVAETFEKLGIGKKDGMLRLLRSSSLIEAVGLGSEGITSLEGYLFPNTYFFDKRDTPENLIRRMVDGFLHTWTPDMEFRAREIGLSRKEVVILASMVEKETGAAFERPMIASVFFNRMKKKMRFQSDPTTAYGMGEFFAGNLRKEDLRRKTPYNTYTVPGLPIGPISNPSREAVRAVLYPADTDFLYFVSKNDGTHMFTKTYGDHSDWVKKLQVDPKAREGKSWRDLSKKEPVSGAAESSVQGGNRAGARSH